MSALAETRSHYATVAVSGEELALTLDGALWWPLERTLIVADLHLEKGSAFAARGVFLPPYDTPATLRRLAAVVRRLQPRRVVLLGDTFHDRGAEARLPDAERLALIEILRGREAIFVAGNHDPAPARLPGLSLATMRLGPLLFRHEPGSEPSEIAGHLHPVARIATRGRTVRRKAFVTDGARLILPSFGAYTGGLNVRDPAFLAIFQEGFVAHLIGDERLFAFPKQRCLPD